MYEFIIKTIAGYIRANVPEIKTIDVWRAELTDLNAGAMESLARPAAYIELSTLDVSDLMGTQAQQLEGSLVLHLVVDSMGGLNEKASNFERNLLPYSIVDKLYGKLTGLCDTDAYELGIQEDSSFSISNVVRTSIEFPQVLGNIAEGIITFDYVIVDNYNYAASIEADINDINTEVTIER